MTGREEEIASALPANLDALPRLRGFRLRGTEMTRLETFIDATFAFAISMLVISAQQIPDNIQALLAAFKNVPTFICSIAVLGIYWRGHWLWSRRYGIALTRACSPYRGVAAAGLRVKANQAVIDGEIVALDAQRSPSFQALQPQHWSGCAKTGTGGSRPSQEGSSGHSSRLDELPLWVGFSRRVTGGVRLGVAVGVS